MARPSAPTVFLVLALADTAAGVPPRQDIEARLQVLRRILPDGPEVSDGLDGLQKGIERAALVSSLHLEGMSTSALADVVTEDVGYVPVDVSAVLRPSAALDPDAVGNAFAAFVESLSRGVRQQIVDRLAFEAKADGTLRFSARISLCFRPTVPLLEGVELLNAKVATIERAGIRAVWPQGRLKALSGDQPRQTYLTSLALEGSDIDAHGVAPWPVQARDWASPARLGITSLEWTQPDACQRFAVHARFLQPPDDSPGPPRGPAILVGGAVDDWCSAPEASALRLPFVRSSGPGPLMLRARDLDIVDAMLLLGRTAGQDLVVDGDVAGRLGVELKGMTLETALAAFEPLGVFASPPGRIRRVARGARPAPPRSLGSESPVTFWFRRLRSEDAFAQLAELSGDPVLVPRPPLPAVSVSATAVPWDALFEALATSAGLELRREGGSYRAARPGQPASELVGTFKRSGGPATGLAGIRGDQLELSALAMSGKGWSAWMVTPHGALLEYKAGDRFLDGQVMSVDASGVELRVEHPEPSSPVRFRDRRLDLGAAP